MSTEAKDKKVSDMTKSELQQLIRETIYEIIDPDYGLQLNPAFEESLKETIKQKERGEGITLEEAKKTLGLK
ncbi:MAG: hypothetical protein GXO97_09040 [Nitrospirae bacterium]|nr:hypothetical protein [Nitrospirota bacterium]